MVPKTFELFGRRYTTHIKDMLPNDYMGMIDHTAGRIYFLKPNSEFNPARDSQEHTYWHEVLHAMFIALGEKELNDNEELIDRMAGCLHQILKTSKGRLFKD